MKNQVKIWSVLLMLVMVSSLAATVQKPTVQKTTAQQTATANQVVPVTQDVITASDAGGGYLSTRDILLILLIIFAVIGLIVVF